MVEVGEPAPKFTLPDQDNHPRILDEFLGKKNVVLAFYFADFSGVCTKEMCAFRDGLSQLESFDANMIGISADLHWSHKAFAEKNNLKLPLLSDWNRDVIRRYDVYHEEIFGLKMMPRRSVFIIDKNGIIRYKWVSNVPKDEPNYDEVADQLRKLKS